MTLLGAATVVVALLVPSAALAATPAPAPAPTGGAPAPVAPATDDASSVRDVATVIGFTIVAGVVLVLIIRAGLRSATAEDDE